MLFVIVVVAVLALAVLFIPVHPTTAATPLCIENLRFIEETKDQWATSYNKTTNDVPTWDDLRPFFPAWMTNSVHWTNGRPVCPDGGIYTIGRVGVPPTCSIGGYKHSLPK